MRFAHGLIVCLALGGSLAGERPASQQRDNSGVARAQRFETEIAPLFARHCLECHDSATHQGGLDLSRKTVATSGGESGPAIVPGKAAQGLLWTLVESNQMPDDRTPLTTAEKQLLREWNDRGATWSLDVIANSNNSTPTDK